MSLHLILFKGNMRVHAIDELYLNSPPLVSNFHMYLHPWVPNHLLSIPWALQTPF